MSEIASLGDLRGKRVLVRSDLNVPLSGGAITDDGRVRASVPTIKALTEAGARVIVCAHLGRPSGSGFEEKYSLAPAAARLGELLGQPVTLAADTVGESAKAAVAGMADGDVVMLENLRFNAGETAKVDADRAEFADALAGLADAYVSDGFGVVHRKQASVYDVATRLPSAMGGLVKAEVDVLRRLTVDPERPYAVVLGGAKVADKLAVIDNLLGKADRLLIGGGMLFTFLAAQGHEIGKSLFDAEIGHAASPYCVSPFRTLRKITGPNYLSPAASVFSADSAPIRLWGGEACRVGGDQVVKLLAASGARHIQPQIDPLVGPRGPIAPQKGEAAERADGLELPTLAMGLQHKIGAGDGGKVEGRGIVAIAVGRAGDSVQLDEFGHAGPPGRFSP